MRTCLHIWVSVSEDTHEDLTLDLLCGILHKWDPSQVSFGTTPLAAQLLLSTGWKPLDSMQTLGSHLREVSKVSHQPHLRFML